MNILIIFVISLYSVHIEANNNNNKSDTFAYLNINTNGRNTTIVGTSNHSWNDDVFYAFRAIPFAKPPIGELRFKDPQQMDHLPEHIEARFEGHDCPSIFAINASEDCLILNVYTKELQPVEPLPVLVFIHPGGLYVASGLSEFFAPEYLLTKPMLLLTFNYRLGTLGFLNIDTEQVPGNAGFKDQVFALRWVQKYIKHFGGNPDDITLLGYSAGAMSIALHLASPMSVGLFHKAIIMSGSLPPQAILSQSQQLELAIKQAHKLNCTLDAANSTQSILQCLNRFSGTEIAATLRQLFDFGKDNRVYLWLPVIESNYNQERFLVQDFYESLQQGLYQHVPILYGFTDGEFCTSAAEVLSNATLEREFYEHFNDLAPLIFMYDLQPNVQHITDSIRQRYLQNSSIGHSDFNALCDLFSDAMIRFGANRFANLTATKNDVYAYKFTYKGEFSFLTPYKASTPKRVEHMDDLRYLFYLPPLYIAPQDADAKIVQRYVDFFYNFMIDGKPSLKNSDKFPNKFISIGEELTVEDGINFPNADFWNSIIP